MSKQKKPRNKKYNPRQALDNNALQVAENALNRITFIGSSIRRMAPYAGRGFHMTTTPRIRMIATDMLVQGLYDQNRAWKLWVAHLSSNSAGEIEAESMVCTLDDYNLGDFCQHAEQIIRDLRPEGAGEYFGYAFVAAPNERYELADSEDRLLENFMHSGLLDKEKHLDEKDQFVTREQMTIMLMSDTGKFDVNVQHKVEVPDMVYKTREETLLETVDVPEENKGAVQEREDDY
ncbi:hypothetical protein STRATTON_133 [Erwinia phage vB_EamM_Stratton]|uniref:Uncharacterized protein n=1 Tax=Erwinia phage vB_EamM_Stratton TaxID=1883378 RepID=A0A1B2IH24_9CAUD|nr:hypothetical protein STRATTON_133 [Erwinia phage vB_EamM_Stratton]